MAQPALPASLRRPLFTLAMCTLLSSLATSIVNAGLPSLAQAFDASFQSVQWVLLAYLVSLTSLIVGVGRLGDILGKRRLLLAGLTLFTAASVSCGFAPNLGFLIAARAIQGVGAAAMMALSMALLGAMTPRSLTGTAMGSLGAMSAIGTTLGPALGGALVSAFGWPALFLATVPLSVLTLLLVCRHLPADRTETPPRRGAFDPLGTLLLATALATYALAVTLGRGEFGWANVALLTAAMIATGLFVLVENKVATPLVRLGIFRDQTLRPSLALNILVSTVMMATLVVGPFYLSRSLGLGALGIGTALSIGPLVAALVSVSAGRMADRLGPSRIMIGGLGAIAAGSLILATVASRLGVFGYVVSIAVMTAGYGSFQSANNASVMRAIRPDEQGAMSGMLNLSRNLGLVTGAAVMGAVFAFAAAGAGGLTTTAEAATTGMRATFAVATGLMIVALALAMRAPHAPSTTAQYSR